MNGSTATRVGARATQYLLLVAAAGVACGDDSSALRDASIDASLDADTWPCEPEAPSLPEPSGRATVQFETGLPLLPQGDAGAIDTFFDGTQIVVATPQQLHFLTLEGVLERNVLVELPKLGVGSARIQDIVLNGSGFGAVLLTTVDAKYRFCQIDPISGADESRCTELSAAPQFDGNVVIDGTGYAVYGYRYVAGEYAMIRWRFGAAGASLGEEELWRDTVSQRVLNAASGAGGVLVSTGGTGSGITLHHVDPHTAESVRPPMLQYSQTGVVINRWSGYDSEAMGHARHMRCANFPEDEDYSKRRIVVTRYDLELGTHSSTIMALPLFVNAALMLDGDQTSFAYAWDFSDVRFSRLDASGAAVRSEVPIPLSLDRGFEVQFVGAGRTFGPRRLRVRLQRDRRRPAPVCGPCVGSVRRTPQNGRLVNVAPRHANPKDRLWRPLASKHGQSRSSLRGGERASTEAARSRTPRGPALVRSTADRGSTGGGGYHGWSWNPGGGRSEPAGLRWCPAERRRRSWSSGPRRA
jgi:hypothetical protein